MTPSAWFGATLLVALLVYLTGRICWEVARRRGEELGEERANVRAELALVSTLQQLLREGQISIGPNARAVASGWRAETRRGDLS